jgi:hypothetical protein
LGRNAMPFPHRVTHPLCDKNPLGFYNQAKRSGIADEDIPVEYRPAPGVGTETRILNMFTNYVDNRAA